MRLLLTNNVSTPSEFLVGNIFNNRIGTIETSQKMLLSYLIRPYYKNPRNMKDFQKSLEIKAIKATAKQKVTATIRNNDRDYKNDNTTRETGNKVDAVTI